LIQKNQKIKSGPIAPRGLTGQRHPRWYFDYLLLAFVVAGFLMGGCFVVFLRLLCSPMRKELAEETNLYYPNSCFLLFVPFLMLAGGRKSRLFLLFFCLDTKEPKDQVRPNRSAWPDGPPPPQTGWLIIYLFITDY
jgi:hypothetical protein